MGNSINGRIRRVLTAYENHRREVAAFVFAAVMVTFGVTIILHNNGVAATHAEQVLECRQTGAVAHTHEANCFDAQGNLVCPLPELELHTHTDDCYVETYELACGLEEHVHDASCYDSEGNLVCSIPEHTHTDACYKTERVLVCGKDEITELHSHGPECFRTVEVEDAPAVQPTEDITYESQVDGVADPQTDDAADLAEDAEPEVAETMPAQRFTHSIKDAEDRLVLRVDVDAPEGALPAGATMVAQWVETTSLTAKQQEAVKTAIATRTDGAAYAQQAVDITFRDAEGNEVKPERRVAVTFTSTLLDTEDLPIVAHVDDLTLEEQQTMAAAIDGGETAEEAEPERRAEALDKLSDEALSELGISLASNQLAVACDQFSTFVLNVTTLDHSMLAEGETVRIEVVAPAAAGIPADAQLRVSEIPQGTPEYISYEADAVVAAGADEAQFSRFFDIKIVRADGTEVEPQAPVQVRIKLADAPADAPASVVHFEDDAAVGEAPELIPSEVNDLTAEFEAEGFSIYGVVYTVDLHWEVDGKTYEFSLPGGGYASLADLVEALGIAGEGTEENSEAQKTDGVEVSDSTKKFVANVVDVEFSNPELLSVSKAEEGTTVGAIKDELGLECEYSAELTEEQIAEINAQAVDAGDWALISLKPFDTNETLTVTMKDGAQFVIKVTDAQNVIDASEFDGTTKFVIWAVSGQDNNSYALMGNGSTAQINPSNIDSLGDDYLWTIEYQGNDTGVNRYYIRSAANPSRYLTLSGGYVTGNNLIQGLTNNARTEVFHDDDDSTWHLQGWGYTSLNLGWNSHAFEGNDGYHTNVYITKQGQEIVGDYIILSPMNNNGVLPGNTASGNITSTSYKNFTIDEHYVANSSNTNGTKQYSRIRIPVQYNDDGTATIVLPSDEELTTGFRVSDAEPAGTSHTIIQDPNSDKYKYTLRGWVNIATHEYIGTSSGPATVTVDRDNLNVFYADWVAQSYDFSYNGEALKDDVVSTNSFAKIRVWDYNEIYNLISSGAYKVDNNGHNFAPRDSINSEEWYIHQNDDGGQADFVQFVDNTNNVNSWQYGTLGNTQGRNEGNRWSNYSSWEPRTGIVGPHGSSTDMVFGEHHVIKELFTPATRPSHGVTYLGEADYLFSYNEETQVYSYDSELDGAVYNQSDQRFYVTDEPREYVTNKTGWAGRRNGFLPLNNSTGRLAYNDGTINYWFGMQIDMDFWLPDTPGKADANKVRGEDMYFSFRGDDDVWVFVDDKLVLDIGGIHEALNGIINFTTGEVHVQTSENGPLTLQTTLAAQGIGAGSHTLSFYYLERGGNESNCQIKFNLVPRYEQDPPNIRVTKVTKEWDEGTPDDEELKNRTKFELRTTNGEVIDTVYHGDTGGITYQNTWTYTWKYLDPNKEYVVYETTDSAFDQASQEPIISGTNLSCWAVSSYDGNRGFGSHEILLGNGLPGGQGCLLVENGSQRTTDLKFDVVEDQYITDDIKWRVIDSETENEHFHLQSASGGYLSIVGGSISLVNDINNSSLFYMSPKGDLNDSNSQYRLLITPSGAIGVGQKYESTMAGDPSPDRIHVYAEKDLSVQQYWYTFRNTYKKTPIQFKKVSIENVEGIDSPGLAGATFSLYKERPAQGVSPLLTLTSDETGYLKANSSVGDNTGTHPVTVANGEKILWTMPGTYYLKEDTAPAGYVPIEDVIEFKVTFENGQTVVRDLAFTAPELMTAPKYVIKDHEEPINGKDTIVLTGLIPNTSGVELPHSGGMGTTVIYFAGTVLAALAGATLLVRRRRAEA